MIIKIDWISFSFRRPIGSAALASEEEALMWRGLRDLLGDVYSNFIGEADWIVGKGRAPYEVSYRHELSGIVLFWHTRLDHALIEIGGQACDWLKQQPWHELFLKTVQPRVTRIDIACDIKTNLDPVVFAGQRNNERFRSHSEFVSESGTTAYVGSRTSNRYARVYRYNEPHPRSHLLRVEHVMKAEDAKTTLQYVLASGLQATASALGTAFGWSHPLWRVEAPNGAELSVYRAERREGKTIFWLADTVAPLLLRLEQEGVIDIDQWIADHLTKFRKQK